MTNVPSPGPEAADQKQIVAELTSRLDRAERQLKSFTLVIPALAILAVAPHLIRLDKPSTLDAKLVVAESIGVKNASGDIVARLGTASDGSPNFILVDANRKIRMMAALNAKGEPAVSLFDPDQNSRAALSLNDRSEPSLAMLGAGNLARGVFSVDTSGAGHLSLYATAGGLDLGARDGHVRWTPAGGTPVDAIPVTK
jgi:hypothetical protein